MKKARLKGLNDYLALLVRRRWWLVIPTVMLCGFAVLVALLFPKMYPSQTMILLQPRDVPADFVKDLVGEDTGGRLSAIEQMILSRSNLLKILSEFENQLPEFRALNDERKVAKLNKRISIEFTSAPISKAKLSPTNIRISYRDRNPGVAQKVTARLASLFIEQDSRTREDKVFGTAEFFQAELDKVSEQLRQSEDKLRILKQRYRYELPSEQETNLRTLDRLQIQKNGNLEALDRFVTLQMNLERQISVTPQTIPNEALSKQELNSVRKQNPLVETYRKKEQEYKELIVKAKPTHPDVRRLKAELDQLIKEIPPEDLAASENSEKKNQSVPDMIPNPAYQNLIAQLSQLKTDIQNREKEKKWIEGEMVTYSQRIQNSPAVEQDMQAIVRTNGDLVKQHDDLKAKLEDAKLAGSLESRQKGEQFAIIDPANYPLEPSTPSRIVILLAGFGVSLAAGIVCAVAADTLNQQVWTHHELERALETPVLVEIPSIISPADIRNTMRRRLVHALLLVIFSGAYLGGLYYLYIRQSTVLRLMDPLIEKIAERAAG
jgi:polysaccharide biosynthesis transport protein